MAAAQCRSSKCTAERKGFRRELDSWRLKLIHCIGFESILEGIYGPLLLKDLSIFEDCEPEDVDDWSAEASCSHCSFCNLPLEKVCDHVPAAASPLSSPSEYSPSQAPAVSDSSQSAHRFLQAVFHKKDLPSTYDSNLPLVAQELMKKMIHRFAIEYISKSKLHTVKNGLTTGPSSPLSDAADPDGPLDLTVSRNQENQDRIPQSDGVLDLSKKNSACSASMSPADHKTGLSVQLPMVPEELGEQGRQPSQSAPVPALKAVFCLLCPAHRALLYQILRLAYQEGLLCSSHLRSANHTHCCHCGFTPPDNNHPCPFQFSNCKTLSSNPPCSLNDCGRQGHSGIHFHPPDSKSSCSIHHHPCNDCRSPAPQASGCFCAQTCRVAAYSVCCLKNLHSVSCQNLSKDHSNCSFASSPSSTSLCSTSLCPASSICCSSHSSHTCPCYGNHACLKQVCHKIEAGDRDGDPPCPVLKREPIFCPSPPPLSPSQSDSHSRRDEKPPSLLHHKDEDGANLSSPLSDREDPEGACLQKVADKIKLENIKTDGKDQAMQNPCGSLLQDVVDRFSERLDTIRPLERDLPLSVTTNQSLEKRLPLTHFASQSPSPGDAHLSEIITTVLHTGSNSDYNLTELFNCHDNNEARSPNTRSRRRQEVLAAMKKSQDHASTRRHSLKIKRELAMLDLSYHRKKLSLTKKVQLKTSKNVSSSTCNTSSETTPTKEESEKGIKIQDNKGVCQKPEKLGMTKEIRVDNTKMKEDRITQHCKIENVITLAQDIKICDILELEKVTEAREKRQEDEPMPYVDEVRSVVKEEIKTVIVTEETERETLNLEEMANEVTKTDMLVASSNLTANEPQNRSHNPCIKDKVIGCSSPCDKCSNCENGNQKKIASDETGNNSSTKGNDQPKQVRRRIKVSPHSHPYVNKEAGRSRRNIIPPQRFSSYVTEPRKMYFAACFSESIFNQKKPKEIDSKPSHADTSIVDPDVTVIPLESKETTPGQDEPAYHSANEKISGTSNMDAKDISENIIVTTEGPFQNISLNRKVVRDYAARTNGRSSTGLSIHNGAQIVPRTTSKCSKSRNPYPDTCIQSHPNPQTQYSSPIKLMYASPVRDREGVKYSLKSAASGFSGQIEETFDPCEESSWAGAPKKSPSNENTTSPPKRVVSPQKVSTLSPKTPSTPPKSINTIHKNASTPPKSFPLPHTSFSSSPKTIPKRSGENTPPKHGLGTDNQRSPGSLKSGYEKQHDPTPFHEMLPTKRRPGRPKKLGPPLETKVKRPIGRPRKLKGAKTENISSVVGSEMEEMANKNLKITVVYGRSRRNKRLVSEGIGQLQAELHEPKQSDSNLGKLLQNSKAIPEFVKTSSSECAKELDFVRPVKDRETVFHSSSNIKCQKIQDVVSIRKPGRPAKVKISGISITVTTVSPRQRKIQINKDARQSLDALNHKKALLSEFTCAKDPQTIHVQSNNEGSRIEKRVDEREAEQECKEKHSVQPLAVRHSVRVRKPSVYLLHSVATSRSYNHSTALLRRSRKLLLNKASNQRRQGGAQGDVQISEESKQFSDHEKKQGHHNLNQVARISVDSIFPPGDTLRWWAPSAEEETLNQELARRIRLVSDTWVSDTIENQELTSKPTLGIKGNRSSKKSRRSSIVQMLFDCPPRRPRSCSMQQLCSWFMQTTETQSLAIVKKASSRNPYELMHYPRSANKGNSCPSPQAERLRKHIKKFAKIVPKSPSQHHQAQQRQQYKKKVSSNIKRQLFTQKFPPGRLNQGVPWWRGRVLGKYSTTLLRAKARFLTREERQKWSKTQRNNLVRWRLALRSLPGHTATLQSRERALFRLATDNLCGCLDSNYTISPVDHTHEPNGPLKNQELNSTAWSPETIKECRVFLKKINSPDNKLPADEWESYTVTLDNGSPSALCLARRELQGDVKAVKTEKKKSRTKTAPKASENSTSNARQVLEETPVERLQGKKNSPGFVSIDTPPPTKMLRQSRMSRLTGPRWCDYVIGN